MPSHLPEYLAEVAGTALMMLIGVGAIALMWADVSPMPGLIESPDLRRLLTGIMFAGGATLVVVSPLGQRSGGHLNPAVTMAFWMKGNIATVDAVFYVLAQICGALLGVGIAALLASDAVRGVQFGITLPGDGFSVTHAFLAEIAMDPRCIRPDVSEVFAESSVLFLGYSLSDITFRVIFRIALQQLQLNRQRAHVPAPAGELLFLAGRDEALRIEHHDVDPGPLVERRSHGATRVTGSRDQDRQRPVTARQGRQRSGKEARAVVLELSLIHI